SGMKPSSFCMPAVLAAIVATAPSCCCAVRVAGSSTIASAAMRATRCSAIVPPVSNPERTPTGALRTRGSANEYADPLVVASQQCWRHGISRWIRRTERDVCRARPACNRSGVAEHTPALPRHDLDLRIDTVHAVDSLDHLDHTVVLGFVPHRAGQAHGTVCQLDHVDAPAADALITPQRIQHAVLDRRTLPPLPHLAEQSATAAREQHTARDRAERNGARDTQARQRL